MPLYQISELGKLAGLFNTQRGRAPDPLGLGLLAPALDLGAPGGLERAWGSWTLGFVLAFSAVE